MSREDDGSMLAYVQQVQENKVFRVGEHVRFSRRWRNQPNFALSGNER